MEIIQYEPVTETVFEIPLLIFPPWINKFYILDLKPQNSLIKWIVDQGIETALIDPGKPWQNGTTESFNGKFRDECLSLE